MWILAKELVGKRFFDLFDFYTDAKFYVKVVSSLARILQKVVGISFFFICLMIWFEVRFFNFATYKVDCDWLTLILNMVHLYQNKTINILIVSALSSPQVQVELEDSKNITLWYFKHSPNIGYWECVSYTNNTMLGNSIEKKWNWYCQHCQKVNSQNSLASIHFQFCFKYIIPCFTMLYYQILSLAMGSNFHIVHPCQP